MSDAIGCGGKVAAGSANVLIDDSPKLTIDAALDLPDLEIPPINFDRPGFKRSDGAKPAACNNAKPIRSSTSIMNTAATDIEVWVELQSDSAINYHSVGDETGLFL